MEYLGCRLTAIPGFVPDTRCCGRNGGGENTGLFFGRVGRFLVLKAASEVSNKKTFPTTAWDPTPVPVISLWLTVRITPR